MKTRTLLLTICTLWASTILADSVTEQQAQQTAYDFLQKHLTAGKMLHRAAITVSQAGTSDAYYAFNIGHNEGFVLVSSDDRITPILGYSTKGRFDMSSMPDNMRSLLAEYEAAIRSLRSNNASVPQATMGHRAKEYANVEPIVKTNFNQRAPYWNDCPVLDYGGRKSHAPTGCIATALAQILTTFQHPAKTKAEIPAYQFTFDSKAYTMPAIKADSTIAWDKIALTYEEEYIGTPADSAIAALMAVCGSAVQMNYGVNELGGSITTADKAVEALTKYFDFEERTVRLIYRRNYSLDHWTDILYNELKAGRPVIYSGLSADNGHTFICDGYEDKDGNDFFHINWGWGGQADGWFHIIALNPSSLGTGGGTDTSGYSMAQSAIIGIQPNDGTDTPTPQLLTVNYLYPQNYETSYQRSNNSKDFTGINIIYDVWNWSGNTNTFDIGLRIIDQAGNTMQEIADTEAQGRLIVNNTHWQTNRSGSAYAVPVSISSSLPDGEYQLIATSRVTGSGPMSPDYDADSRFISFTITGNQLNITGMYKEPKVDLHLVKDMEITPVKEGDSMVGKLHTVRFSLINNGTVFRDDIYYTLNEANPDNPDKNTIYATYVDLDEGQTHSYRFNFKPNRQGDNTLRLYAKDQWDALYLLGTQTITVTGAPEIKLYVTDIVNYDTELGAVIGNTLDMTVKLVNEGTVPFNGRYDVFLSYSEDQGANWIDIQYSYPSIFKAWVIWSFSLEAGESIERQFKWEKLKYERYHRVLFAESNEDGYDNNSMLKTEDIRLVESSDIRSITTDNGGPKTIYTLQGTKLGNPQQPLKPGIYIQNGRKILVK